MNVEIAREMAYCHASTIFVKYFYVGKFFADGLNYIFDIARTDVARTGIELAHDIHILLRTAFAQCSLCRWTVRSRLCVIFGFHRCREAVFGLLYVLILWCVKKKWPWHGKSPLDEDFTRQIVLFLCNFFGSDGAARGRDGTRFAPIAYIFDFFWARL